MLLNSCNDFSDSIVKNIEFLSYVICFLCILTLLILIKTKMLFNYKNIKRVLFFVCFIFLIALIFLFLPFLQNYNGCYQKYHAYKSISPVTVYNDEIKDISLNKVIVVGDSRMELIERDKKELDVPTNFSFIALSGADIYWFKNNALKDLQEKLLNKDQNYKYHVVINMGVNDLQDDININNRVSKYFVLYRNLATKFPDVNFYILSVNPIDEKIINKRWKKNIRTNNKISKFNTASEKQLYDSELKNLYNCDSYHSLDFVLPDGLHFDHNTDQEILDYISNKCVKYE